MSAVQHKNFNFHLDRAAPDYCDVAIILPSDFQLESGEMLEHREIYARIHGSLDDPVVFVAGGISSDRKICTTATDTGWWQEAVGCGAGIDTDKYCVIGFDFLTPNSGSRAAISTNDQARAIQFALKSLRIQKLHAFVGASYGAMIGLAFASANLLPLGKLVCISGADRPSIMAVALRGIQQRIVEFGIANGDAGGGLSLARQLAMTTYRTPEEFQERFGENPVSVSDYLCSRGSSFHLEAEEFLAMSRSIDAHCVEASQVQAQVLLIAIDGDRLVSPEEIRECARKIPNASMVMIASKFGHDAFLKEQRKIAEIIEQFIK